MVTFEISYVLFSAVNFQRNGKAGHHVSMKSSWQPQADYKQTSSSYRTKRSWIRWMMLGVY